MILDIIIVIIGISVVLAGADRLTEGASALARRLHVSEIVIGLTIVAAGTSAPELFVSLVSALKGTPDLAVGNVVGSNIMNAMLIVGCAAMVAPMVISRSTVHKDIPFAVIASVLLVLACIDGQLSWTITGHTIGRLDGVMLLVGYVLFMYYTLKHAKADDSETSQVKAQSVWLSIIYVVVGLAALVFGSDWFVGAASRIATSLGVGESVIGLTIVAGGTSLPELATSVVAARKGRSAMAIGNVIGSNVFNVLMILGVTALICPMQINGITMIDLLMTLVSVALVWFFARTRYTVARWEGGVLTAGFLGYMAWLLSQA